MKNLLLAFLLFVSFAQPAEAALTDNLVSYWKLDETSGNRADAHSTNTLTDVNTVLSGTGKISNAADFESSAQERLTRADNAALSLTGAMTISMWLNPESLTSSDVFLTKWVETGNQRSYAMDVQSDKLRFLVSNDGDNLSLVTAASNLSTGVYTHVVVTYNPSTRMEIFFNGVSNANNTTSIVANGFDSTAQFALGHSSEFAGDIRYYDGLMDEVGIWSRVLTQDEITALYNGGAGFAYPFVSAANTIFYRPTGVF